MKTGFHHYVIEAQINSPSSNSLRDFCFRANICIKYKLLLKRRKMFANQPANHFLLLMSLLPQMLISP